MWVRIELDTISSSSKSARALRSAVYGCRKPCSLCDPLSFHANRTGSNRGEGRRGQANAGSDDAKGEGDLRFSRSDRPRRWSAHRWSRCHAATSSSRSAYAHGREYRHRMRLRWHGFCRHQACRLLHHGMCRRMRRVAYATHVLFQYNRIQCRSAACSFADNGVCTCFRTERTL